TTSFQRWAECLKIYARSSILRQEVIYWLAEPRTQLRQLPVDHHLGGINTWNTVRVVSAALTETETYILLQETPAAYHTHIDDLLLTALVQTFARWTGNPQLLLDLEGHGREEIMENLDLSRTIGWFTTIFPVLLDLEGVTEA